MKKRGSFLSLKIIAILSLAFVAGVFLKTQSVSAASATPITTSTSNWTTTTIRYNWVKGADGDEMYFTLDQSTNGTTFTNVTSTIPSTTLNYTFTGLATNTQYWFRVASVSSTFVATSTYATSTGDYTLANTPGTPTIGTPTITTLPITIAVAGNPTSTTYSVYNTTTQNYLDSEGFATTTPIWQTTSTWGGGDGLAARGLTANTLYQFVVIARNGANTTTATSTISVANYTLANAPTSAGVASAANSLSFSWTGDSTAYYAEDITAGTNSGWTTALSFGSGTINCGVSHSFRVKGRNVDLTETAWSSTSAGTTNACGTAIAINTTPAVPAVPATPAVPGVSPAVPATPATPASVSLPSSASPRAVFVHTLRVGTKGKEVKALQQKLRELGYFKHPTNTGYFGPVTRAAVKAFQKAEGISPVGHVGPATRAALNSL